MTKTTTAPYMSGINHKVQYKCKQLNDISYERTKELKYKSLCYFFRKKDSKEIAIFYDKTKNKKYHTFGTVPKSNSNIDIPNTRSWPLIFVALYNHFKTLNGSDKLVTWDSNLPS
jgi:hypothetical protein